MQRGGMPKFAVANAGMSEHGGAGFACGSAGLAMPPSPEDD